MWLNTVMNDNTRDIKMAVKTQQFYYDLLSQGYMVRRLRAIIRPSNEPIQDYLITSALGSHSAHSICNTGVHTG
jgi:hypothetical protein